MLHSICGAVLILSGRIYIFVASPAMVYYADLIGGPGNPYFVISSVVFSIIGALHFLRALWLISISIRSRKLVFDIPFRVTASSRSLRSFSSMRIHGHKTCQHVLVKRARHEFKVLIGWYLKVAGRNGYLGVESKYFSYLFVIREIIEVSSQTYQAKRSCDLVPRPWINHFMMALLIFNCWSTPILQMVFFRRPGAERVACLMFDAMFNIGSNFVVPIMIFVPYYKAFDMTDCSFPVSYLYNTFWFTRFMMENRVVFAVSFVNLVSKTINHVSIYSSITTATTLIQRRRLVPVDTTNMAYLPVAKTATSSRLNRGVRILHALFIIYGLILLTVYSRAVYLETKPMIGCQATTSPWFSTKYPCFLFTFSCYDHHVLSPSGNELDQLDTDSLASLQYVHCPELHVPNAIQNFPNLLSFQLYNCSIRSWPRESAITPEKHAQMLSVCLMRTNMTEFPEGLLGPLPSTLTDIELSVSNITKLPDDLGDQWNFLSSFFVEYTDLQEVPESIFQIPIILLSFADNKIKNLPSFDRIAGTYYILDLGGNPFQALPATIGTGFLATFLNLEHSNISTLPSWIFSSVGSTFGKGSPYCQTIGPNVSASSASLGCLIPDPGGESRAPLNLIDSEYTL